MVDNYGIDEVWFDDSSIANISAEDMEQARIWVAENESFIEKCGVLLKELENK